MQLMHLVHLIQTLKQPFLKTSWHKREEVNYCWLVHGLRQQMHWTKFIANCPNRELLQEMVIRTAKWVIWIAYKGARSLKQGRPGDVGTRRHIFCVRKMMNLRLKNSNLWSLRNSRYLQGGLPGQPGLWWVSLKLREEVWLAKQKGNIKNYWLLWKQDDFFICIWILKRSDCANRGPAVETSEMIGRSWRTYKF